MSANLDINSLLQAGQFPSRRAKSPAPPEIPRSRTPTFPQTTPAAYAARSVPRSYEPAPAYRRQRAWPPPPSVEDEADSVAREHGSVVSEPLDEDVKSRGDPDQNPVIMEVHEYNPERRFVILTKDSDDGSESVESPGGSDTKPYAANTGRKYAGGRDDARRKDREESDPTRIGGSGAASAATAAAAAAVGAASMAAGFDSDNRRPSTGRRKSMSHQDLPRISTNILGDEDDDPSPPRMYRAKSATSRPEPTEDYFSSQYSARPSASTGPDLLSPQIITQGSGRRAEREERYFDERRSSNGNPIPPPKQRSRSSIADERRFEDRNERPSVSSPATKRMSTNLGDPSKQPRQTSAGRYPDGPRYRDEYSSSRPDTKTASPPSYSRDRDGNRGKEQDRDRDRNREGISRRSSVYKGRGSPPRREESYSSDEYSKPTSSNHRRRKSIVVQEGAMLSPDGSRPSLGGRSRSKAPPSPIPSPKLPQRQQFPEDFAPNPRASFTFPRNFAQPSEKPVPAPYPEDDEPTRGGRLSIPAGDRPSGPRPRSRANSNKNPVLVMPAMPVAIPGSRGDSPPDSRRRSPLPSPPESRVPLSQSSPRQQHAWPPLPFHPSQSQPVHLDKPFGMYRRYSEDMDRGSIPNLPECRRKKPVAGLTDWITLPKCDNFNICPDCYSAAFQNSAYENQLAPFPFRPANKPIACDFGASPWYRIAWLLTLKNRRPDLSVFRQIAAVSASAPGTRELCPGPRRAVRLWHSVRNPRTGKTIPDFNVCFSCAKTVEALLPNLSGVFVHLVDSGATPTKGICALHFPGEERKRFILYFDVLETTSDRALERNQTPDLQSLADEIERLSLYTECHEDNVVKDGNWHVMRDLNDLTVCGECFDDAVRPRLDEGSTIARRFFVDPRRLPEATCQLYSSRMRDIFKKACRANDVRLLEEKVRERRQVEDQIHAKIEELDAKGQNDAETEEEVNKLFREWRKWE